MLLINFVFVRCNSPRPIYLQRVWQLVVKVLLLVYWARGAALIGWNCHYVLDGTVSLLRIENVWIISFHWVWLFIHLLLQNDLLVGLAFSDRVDHAVILLHYHDESVLRLGLHLASCSHHLVHLRNLLRITFACRLTLNCLLTS